LLTEVVPYLLGIAFTVRGEPPLAVPATSPDVLGLSMAKYKQGMDLLGPVIAAGVGAIGKPRHAQCDKLIT
jgi:hypothetical protein